MNLFTFNGKDGHISRNGVMQRGNDALWETAAHTNKLMQKLLQELRGQSFFGMTCCILAMTLDTVGSFLLVELHKTGHVDLVNH